MNVGLLFKRKEAYKKSKGTEAKITVFLSHLHVATVRTMMQHN